MSKKIKYLLCHGFGFSAEFWQNLIPLLDADYEFFDEKEASQYLIFDTKISYIGIGHSIGFQKLNNSGIIFKALVGLQGFLNFCGNKPVQRSFLKKNLTKMIASFSKNKTKSLRFFHQLCGTNLSFPTNFPLECLLKDLHSLGQSYEHCKCPTLIIATDKDPVVSRDIIINNFQRLPQVTIDFIDANHHLLGFLQPNEVMTRIKHFLSTI